MKCTALLLALTCPFVCGPCAAQTYAPVWARQFNGSLNTVDWFAETVVDTQGNAYVVGTTNVDLAQTQTNILLLKYSTNGSLLWSKTFDGPGHGQDTAFDLALGQDGFVYVVGRAGTATSSDFVTLKFHPTDGALVWSRLFDGPLGSIDQAMAVAVDPFGYVFVTGEVWADHVPYSNGDYCTVKYGPTGDLLWTQFYNGPANFIAISDQPRAIAVDSRGDVVVTGDSPYSDNADDMLTVKYKGTDGAELWTARYSSFPSSENAINLAIAANDDVIVAGNTQTNGLRVTLIRYAAGTGQPLWQVDDAFPHGGRLKKKGSFALDRDDNVAISVTYDPDSDNSNLNYNIQTTKYRAFDGARLWSVSYGTTAKYDGQSADSVATDAQGNVWVGGSELVLPHNVVTLWKFAAADGALLWKGAYDGPRQPDVTDRIRVTRSGDVISAGYTGVNVGTGDSDIQVVKFSRRPAGVLPRAD